MKNIKPSNKGTSCLILFGSTAIGELLMEELTGGSLQAFWRNYQLHWLFGYKQQH